MTMPARPPNNVCLFWQTLLGVVAKVMQGTAFRRLATKAGEKSGLTREFTNLREDRADPGFRQEM